MFSLREKILLGASIIGLMMVCIGYMVDFFSGGDKIGEYIGSSGEGIAELSALILLISNGTLMSTWYRIPLLIGGLIFAIGFVLVILGLPYNFEFWMTGIIIIELFYTIRFVMKPSNTLLDWLKYSWICSRCVFSTLVFYQILPKPYELVPLFIFWLTLGWFVRTRRSAPNGLLVSRQDPFPNS